MTASQAQLPADSQDSVSDVRERRVPRLSPHRIAANMVFDGHGLQPYWGMVSCHEPEHADGHEFQALGFDWTVETAAHWNGKIADPQGILDVGLYEYKYKAVCDDATQDRDCIFTFRPGYPEATHVDTGEEIGGLPSSIPECIRVETETTNVDFADVLPLLRAFADSIGLDPSYFTDPHEWSRVYEYEAYLRLDRFVSEHRITGDGGILQQLAQFGSSDTGSVGGYKWDHGEIQGHREAVELDSRVWSTLIPEQRFEKRLKCYHPKHPRTDDADQEDPLYHPKLELQYWAGRSDDSIPLEDVTDFERDCHQAMANVLRWAGVSLCPDREAYIRDGYHVPGWSEFETAVYPNPIPETKGALAQSAETELARPDVSESEFEVIETVADGGSDHYQFVSQLADVSSSTVYRAIQKFSFLESDRGEVRFRDNIARNRVLDVVDRLKRQWDSTKAALQDLTEDAAPLTQSGDPSALERWMATHGAVLKRRTGEMHFEFPDQQFTDREMVEILRSGFRAAQQSQLQSKMENALVSFETRGGDLRTGWKAYIKRGRGLFALGQHRVETHSA